MNNPFYFVLQHFLFYTLQRITELQDITNDENIEDAPISQVALYNIAFLFYN